MESANVSKTSYGGYDGLGRPATSAQATPPGTSSPYTLSYTYKPAGLDTVTYPSGRAVSYGYDSAGRVSSVSGVLGSTTTHYTGSSPIAYAAHGGISEMSLGNTKYEETCFNSRLRAVRIRLGGAAGGGTCTIVRTDLWILILGYGSTNNNGNLLTQTITGPGGRFSQSYGYDALNRLTSASEGANWSRAFGYDAYGNTWVTNGTGVPIDPFTPTTQAWYNAQNRLVNAGLGIAYDSAGNQTAIGGYGRAYDGENRLKTSTIGGVTTTYSYDGDGRRVTKIGRAHV